MDGKQSNKTADGIILKPHNRLLHKFNVSKYLLSEINIFKYNFISLTSKLVCSYLLHTNIVFKQRL